VQAARTRDGPESSLDRDRDADRRVFGAGFTLDSAKKSRVFRSAHLPSTFALFKFPDRRLSRILESCAELHRAADRAPLSEDLRC
jgi:hypothetical protein